MSGGFPPGGAIRVPSGPSTALDPEPTAQTDPKQPVVAGENISRPRSRADDQVSVIRRKRPAGFGGRLLSWLMAYGHENSPRSGLDDTIDEPAILHGPLAKPSDRLP